MRLRLSRLKIDRRLLILAFTIGPFFGGLLFVHTRRGGEGKGPYLETSASIAKAACEIKYFVLVSDGSLPSPQSWKEQLSQLGPNGVTFRDQWGGELLYEQIGEDTIRLSSAGEDRVWWSKDDLVRTYRIEGVRAPMKE